MIERDRGSNYYSILFLKNMFQNMVLKIMFLKVIMSRILMFQLDSDHMKVF